MKLWLFIILVLSGCVSARYHQKQVNEAKMTEIEYAKGLAKRVKEKEITAYEMIKFLEER